MPGELFLRGPAVFHEDLDEGALFLRLFPGQRLFAGRDLDHEVTDAPGFARLHLEILGQVIALVEHAESDDTILVGRTDPLALNGLGRACLHAGQRLGDAGVFGFGFRFAPAPGKSQKAGSQRQRGDS